MQKDQCLLVFNLAGGEGGIRTLGTLRYTAFPMQRDRPLCHLSFVAG